jgi:RluA family pseudouridine synthase
MTMTETLTRRPLSIRVAPSEAGKTVLDLLAGRFTYRSREEWKDSIQRGTVLLNRDRVHPGVFVKHGDVLENHFNNVDEPIVIKDFSIVFEDEFLLAVNKSGDLPCHPAGRYFNNTLWALLKSRRGPDHLSFVNRIDRETSGIVLIAKDPETALNCRRQFEERRVEKRYTAVVEGVFPEGDVSSPGYLAKDPDSPVRKKQRFFQEIPAGENPKACLTEFRKIMEVNGLSLIAAVPLTGRMHQIRATLSALGYPIAGDKLYGVDETLFLRFIEGRLSVRDRLRLRIPRQALHAHRLRMLHPRTARPIELHAPLPADMKDLIRDSL